jgi:hypothetical protein
VQECFKTGLLEVLVMGEGAGDASPPHDHEGDAVCQLPFLVGPLVMELEAGYSG